METAFAKINLALHVRARRPDGYHAIETLFAFAEDGDRLTAEDGDGVRLSVSGPFAAGLDAGPANLVHRAASELRAAFAVADGVALQLDKRLPVAAGLGGGSADAAAALRLLARRWRIAPDAPEIGAIARRLGADVPACLASTPAHGSERGDRLAPVALPGLSGQSLLLVNPGVPLATAPVFAGWDGVDRGPLTAPATLAALGAARNDLTAPATVLVPAIAPLLAWLGAQPGVVLARMSGSGASCFALFADAAGRDAAATAVAGRFPGCWCLATRLR